uniref:hAT-like transposase RNase-H fold domain-containing protein n=1 Tax=Cajanus cajan TaxID=3821 RepID=A0A151TF96_CAJCA|nr:hypothetical protein KK1_011970 [Cajanus cajan]
MRLTKNLSCKYKVIKDMTTRIKAKFDNYWNEYCVNLALGCVIDPKVKLNFIIF